MAKTSNLVGTLFTLFFTSVLAPVLIHVLTDAHNHNAEDDQVPAAKAISSLSAEERLIVQGQGATAEQAWYDAQGKALLTAVTPMVDVQTWTREGKFICAAVLQDAGRLITRCQDLGCTCDRGVWHREVAVFVAWAELADRLRAAHVRVVGDPGRKGPHVQ